MDIKDQAKQYVTELLVTELYQLIESACTSAIQEHEAEKAKLSYPKYPAQSHI
jgi:hypothetical protein